MNQLFLDGYYWPVVICWNLEIHRIHKPHGHNTSFLFLSLCSPLRSTTLVVGRCAAHPLASAETAFRQFVWWQMVLGSWWLMVDGGEWLLCAETNGQIAGAHVYAGMDATMWIRFCEQGSLARRWLAPSICQSHLVIVAATKRKATYPKTPNYLYNKATFHQLTGFLVVRVFDLLLGVPFDLHGSWADFNNGNSTRTRLKTKTRVVFSFLIGVPFLQLLSTFELILEGFLKQESWKTNIYSKFLIIWFLLVLVGAAFLQLLFTISERIWIRNFNGNSKGKGWTKSTLFFLYH